MSAVQDEIQDVVGSFIPEISDDEHRRSVARRLNEFMDEFGQDLLPDSKRHGVSADHLPGAGSVPYDVQEPDPTLDRWCTALARAWSSGLRRQVRTSALLAEPGQILADLDEHLGRLVHTQVLRILLGLLRERRERGALQGADPAQRFEDFRVWLVSPEGRRHLAAEHAAALAHLRRRMQDVQTHASEVVERYGADRQVLAERIPGVRRDARIRRIAWGSGDAHRRGRSVTRLELTGWTAVIYKPRDMRADVVLHELVERVTRSGAADLRGLAIVARDDWGWSEAVDSGAVDPGPAYFRRIGQLTAVLHVLRATDMHYENLITDPQGRPVAVDTETLLTPRPQLAPSYDDDAASRIGRDLLNDSVAGIGTLPLSVGVPGRQESLDIGAVGYSAGQASPFRSHVLQDVGLDTMRVAFEHRALAGHNANPVAAGPDAQEVLARRDAIKTGFREVMAWVRAHRRELGEHLRERLAGLPLRYIHTPTVFYVQLLRMAGHPSLWARPMARLAVLGRVHARDRYDGMEQVPAEEMRQMAWGDVPFLTHRPGSRALLDGEGRTVLEDFFAQDGLELLERGLEQADPRAVQRQCEIIDMLFVRLIPTGGELTGERDPLRPAAAVRPEEGLLDLLHWHARRVGDRLIRSCDPRHPATWIGPQVTTEDARQWVPGTLGYDLYGGSSGQALALAAVGAVAGDAGLIDQADAVLLPIEEQMVSGALSDERLAVGAMTGMSGTLWAIATARRLTGRPDPERVRSALALIVENALEDGAGRELEFTAGLTGALAMARALHSHRDIPQDPDSDGMVRQLGEALTRRLGEHLDEMRAEAAVPDSTAHRLHTGYAHGLAGMIPQLLAHGLAWDDQDAMRLVDDLQDLLDGAYDGQDWARRPGTAERSWAWCHGAPGVLLGWAAVRRLAPERAPQDAGETLRALTRARGMGSNPTYCHGDLGSLEALLEASLADERPDQARLLQRALGRVAADRLRAVEQETADRYGGTDSLMLGRSGQLWAGLRALDPTRHPSLLSLG